MNHPLSRFAPAWLLLLSLFPVSPATWAAAYQLPENGDNVIGAVTRLRLTYDSTFAAIAEQYGLGFQELIDANPGVDPWIPGDGTEIELPTQYVLPDAPREGIVINLAEYRLYYFPPGADHVITYPVGIGRTEFPTPLIETRVVTRIAEPSWTPTADARREHAERGDILPQVVPPGPENPLGPLALQLAVPGYFIHGTNKPFGVGQQVSLGCIRLYNEHILTLSEFVSRGTRVTIVNQPVKVGTRYDEFYLESHRELFVEGSVPERREQVGKLVKERAASLDWQLVDVALESLTGVPVRI
ncbi:MAG: L,D-transpeptidase family protein [Pseudomonadales bacterium]